MIEIVWNEERLTDLYKDLQISRPVVIRLYNRLARRGDREFFGRASSDGDEGHWQNGVHQLLLEGETHEKLSGMEMRKQLVFTVLHECRHFHQDEHWDPLTLKAYSLMPYDTRPTEIDANEWAKLNQRNYRDIITSVRRKTPNGRFGKLAAAERNARG